MQTLVNYKVSYAEAPGGLGSFALVKGFSDNRKIKQSKKSRDSILALQNEMLKMESALDKFPLTHHFAPHIYGREMFLPADHVIVGKIHKHAHLNIIIKGRVQVSTEDGIAEYVGGDVFTSYAGTKRAVHVIEDTVWITVHHTSKTNLEEIENELIADDYKSLKEGQE